MKRIYDCVDKMYIEGKTIAEIARKIEEKDRSKVSRLLSGHCRCLNHRYLLNKESAFIIIDIDSKEEFECADNHNFFYLINEDYNETAAKYIYEISKGRQKGFSFKDKVYSLKGTLPIGKRKFKSESEFINKAHKRRKDQNLIANRARKRVWGALYEQGVLKQKKSFDLIGCTPEFLMGWLESQFNDGMNWQNYGRDFFNGYKSWHMDHIKPCNTFDLSNEEELNRCFHYTNLRPLWEFDNLSRPKDGSDIMPE